MNRPPFSYKLLKAIFFLARPWMPVVTRWINKQPEINGTIAPRIMKESIPPPAQPAIWLHAVSVGEMEAALPIARKLIDIHGAERFLLSTTTKEGRTIAMNKLDGLIHFQFYPFDLPHVIDKFLNHFNPAVYICMETELWPVLTDSLNRRGIPMILANGRISDRLNSTPRWLRPLFRWMFRSFKWIGLQTEEDFRRLKNFVPDIATAEVAGNTKFDIPDPREKLHEITEMENSIGIKKGKLIAFGSTHPGEEIIIADVFNRLKADFDNLSMVLAPRNIHRSNEVAAILTDAGIKFNLRTDTINGILNYSEAECLLLNTVGELTRIYALAQIAFVGGSLIKRGGHNLLEPAAVGVPVLHGPHMDNFRAIRDFLKNADASIEVNSADDLETNIRILLNDTDRINIMKNNAVSAYKAGKGASDRIVAKVTSLLQKE